MRSIIYSALKVIAIILFVVTIVPSIISLIVIWFAPTGDVSSYNLNMILMWFLQIGFYSILAIYLWLAANKLSIMISRDNEQDLYFSIDRGRLLETGFIVIGIYVLIIHIPNVFSQLLTISIV
jgi:hypothetical protein